MENNFSEIIETFENTLIEFNKTLDEIVGIFIDEDAPVIVLTEVDDRYIIGVIGIK